MPGVAPLRQLYPQQEKVLRSPKSYRLSAKSGCEQVQ